MNAGTVRDFFLTHTLRCGKILSEIQSFCKEELVEPFRQLKRPQRKLFLLHTLPKRFLSLCQEAKVRGVVFMRRFLKPMIIFCEKNCDFLKICSACNSSNLFLSLRKITSYNSQVKQTRRHVEHPDHCKVRS